MFHKLPLLSLFLTPFFTIAVPTLPTTSPGLIASPATGVEAIVYSGPRYHPSDDFLAARKQALETGTEYELPADMPHITLQPGTILNMSSIDNSTSSNPLAKRSGLHRIRIFAVHSCAHTPMLQIVNFGCGSGCITLPQKALSARIYQYTHAHPYATMDVWSAAECQGKKLAHFGVKDRDSCDNVGNGDGYVSFIPYFDCGG